MKVSNLLNFVLALILVTIVAAKKNKEKCCGECPKGQKKYYSVDKVFNRCGECCMSQSDFWKYKIFEPGMHQAKVPNQCAELGFTEYENTETHGALHLKMTLDKYKKPRKSHVKAFFEKIFNKGKKHQKKN